MKISPRYILLLSTITLAPRLPAVLADAASAAATPDAPADPVEATTEATLADEASAAETADVATDPAEATAEEAVDAALAEGTAEEAAEAAPTEAKTEEVAEAVAAEAKTEEAADAVPAEAKTEEAADAAPAGVDADEGDAGKECAADSDPGCSPEGASESSAVSADEVDPRCPSRPHVIRCAARYLDGNQNGALEREELEAAMSGVSWILRSVLKVIGSIDTIMKKCDANSDGVITIEQDMEATKETCLATCFKRKSFKRLFFPDCTE